MEEKYIISIDQSTQGTKALLFDEEGHLLKRKDMAHRQIVNEKGWVSHDPEEIYRNTIRVVKDLVEESGIDRSLVQGIGISNQRETTLIWDKETNEPIADAIVWQCSRAADICERPEIKDAAEKIREKTGLRLSPYSEFGQTDFEGFFEKPIPIHAVLGDSHGALFGQGCLGRGDIKATYGTGSSIMMNIGETPVLSTHGVVTSLAWGMDGKVNYVLEGNINYTGAVISWLKDDVRLIDSPGETESLCREAISDDELYFVPAFTGLGAPHWKSNAKALLTGITRTTGKAEIVRAGIECIAYQITDVVRAMEADAGVKVKELRVDGGPTKNGYLMQFQSDILGGNVLVPDAEELSGIGVAYAAGIAMGIYTMDLFKLMKRKTYSKEMDENLREKKYKGWTKTVQGLE